MGHHSLLLEVDPAGVGEPAQMGFGEAVVVTEEEAVGCIAVADRPWRRYGWSRTRTRPFIFSQGKDAPIRNGSVHRGSAFQPCTSETPNAITFQAN